MKALTTITSAAFHDLIDYSIVDQANDSVGTLHSMWSDQNTGALEFLGVKTGWLFGSNHVVPTVNAQVDESSRTIQVPYALDLIKNAPAIDADAEITEDQEAEIYRYYGLGGATSSRTETSTVRSTDTTAVTGLATGAAATAMTADRSATQATTRDAGAGETIEVALREEQLKVGKRQVDAGAVRLRKIIRTEQVQVPVELRSEDVVVERIDAKDVRPGDIAAADFNEKDIDITLHREEAVVAKETVVTGAVRVNKTSEVETKTISDTVRKEDVEVDQSGVKTSATTETHRDDTLPRR